MSHALLAMQVRRAGLIALLAATAVATVVRAVAG